MTNKITREDVISIGKSINKQLTEKEINWVLENYEGYENDEPQSTWDLIVERMLYDIPTITFQFRFDQKVTTWMQTNFDIDAIDEEEANLKALEFVKSGDVTNIDWEEIIETKETMSVEENGGDSTEELYTSDGNLIYQNDKED
jgi:hypothetical protein